MKYIAGMTKFHIEEKTAVTLGKFDGLHRGHRKLLDRIMEQKQHGLKTVIFTFDVPPYAKLNGMKPEVLLTNEERRRMLEDLGADYLIECPFIPEIIHMEPEQFVKKILCEGIHAAYLAVGTDFRFGYQRKGGPDMLLKLAPLCGYEIDVVEKEQYGGRDVSSTYVKEEITAGNMEKAAFLLGYPYTIPGMVVHGRNMGRKVLGIPTLNIIPAEDKLLPPSGVYVSRTTVGAKIYSGITNIGYKPTVGGEERKGVETYLFDFDGDLYDSFVQVQLHAFVRPEMKFDTLDELIGQMHKDIQFGRDYLKV